jgi:hypothetical protein
MLRAHPCPHPPIHTSHCTRPKRVLTAALLGLMLDAVVLLAAAQEVLAAAAGLDVLHAHVQALADVAAIHLGVATRVRRGGAGGLSGGKQSS